MQMKKRVNEVLLLVILLKHSWREPAFLGGNVKYPAIAEESGIQGRVVCTFIVDRDGSITDVKVARSIDPSLDNEAVRVLSQMPKWKPGMMKGLPVRVLYTVPVTFKLQ